MGVLDGKSAIVTGSARGIGRATAELLVRTGRPGPDQRPRRRRRRAGGRRRSQGETAVFAGDLTKPGAADAARAEGDRLVRQDRHHRQQRRLHPRRAGPQDVRRALPGDARHPHRRPLPRDPRRRPAPARARQEGARGRQGGVPQDRQHLLHLRHLRQRRPGQLLLRQGRRGRPHENRRQGVGPVQGERQRGRLRLHRHPPHPGQGGREHDGEGRRADPARASPSRCARWPR